MLLLLSQQPMEFTYYSKEISLLYLQVSKQIKPLKVFIIWGINKFWVKVTTFENFEHACWAHDVRRAHLQQINIKVKFWPYSALFQHSFGPHSSVSTRSHPHNSHIARLFTSFYFCISFVSSTSRYPSYLILSPIQGKFHVLGLVEGFLSFDGFWLNFVKWTINLASYTTDFSSLILNIEFILSIDLHFKFLEFEFFF